MQRVQPEEYAVHLKDLTLTLELSFQAMTLQRGLRISGKMSPESF
jgi:hypothetical protein